MPVPGCLQEVHRPTAAFIERRLVVLGRQKKSVTRYAIVPRRGECRDAARAEQYDLRKAEPSTIARPAQKYTMDEGERTAGMQCAVVA